MTKNEYDVQEIPLDLLEDNPYDKRKKYGDIEGLAKSIQERGLQNPISVIKSDNRFMIIHGHRRTHAFRYLKTKTIPAIIRKESSPHEIMLDLAIENMQRKDLLPVEKGAILEQLFYEIPSVKNIHDVMRLINQVKIKYEMKRTKKRDASKVDSFNEEDIDKAKNMLNILSMSSSTAIINIKLLLLPQEIQERIVSADNAATIPEGMIGFKTGYELTRITDPKIQEQLYEKIIKEKMTHAKTKIIIDRIVEKGKDKIEIPDSPKIKTELTESSSSKSKIEIHPREFDINTSNELSVLIEDLYLFNSKIENIRSKFPLIAEYNANKNEFSLIKKTELDASLDKIKTSCLEVVSNIDKILNQDLKNDKLLQYLKDANLEVEITENNRWRLPNKLVNLLGIKKGDVLLLKIDAIKKLSNQMVISN